MGYELGVDLGTTYTAAATHRGATTQIVELGNRAATIPSVIYLTEDDEILTGEAANRRASSNPGRVAREFKRRIGDPTPVIVGGSPYSAESLSARLLEWVIIKVTEREGEPPARVAVTHPANWGPYKLDLLHQAFRMANLEQVHTLSEPEAAAIHYSTLERIDPGMTVAVFDLGGGTFDAAILRKKAQGFDFLGEPEGIERLGGIDFDAAVFAFVRDAVGPPMEELDVSDPSTVAAVARLRRDCVEAKEALSSDTEVTIPVVLPGLHTDIRLTRMEFEQMIRPSLADTVGAMERAVRSASLDMSEIDLVLLVGGSSRIPLVGQMVGGELGRPVAVDAHPKHSVAQGAAWAAANSRGANLAQVTGIIELPKPTAAGVAPPVVAAAPSAPAASAAAPAAAAPAVPPMPVSATTVAPVSRPGEDPGGVSRVASAGVAGAAALAGAPAADFGSPAPADSVAPVASPTPTPTAAPAASNTAPSAQTVTPSAAPATPSIPPTQTSTPPVPAAFSAPPSAAAVAAAATRVVSPTLPDDMRATFPPPLTPAATPNPNLNPAATPNPNPTAGPEAAPLPSSPAPIQAVSAAGAAALAGRAAEMPKSTPFAGSGRSGQPAEPAAGFSSPAKPGPKKGLLAGIGAVVALVVIGLVVVSQLGRGDDTDNLATGEDASTTVAQEGDATDPDATATGSEGSDTADASDTTDASASTTEAQPTTTVRPTTTEPPTTSTTVFSCSGLCAHITDAVPQDDGELLVTWEAINFDPPRTNNFHAHFYFDVYDAEQVGSNNANYGVERGNWHLTDQIPFNTGGTNVDITNAPAAATQLCVVVADSGHGVSNPENAECVPLP